MDPWLPCATVGDCFRLDSSTCLIDCVPQVLISYRDRVLVVFFSLFRLSFLSFPLIGLARFRPPRPRAPPPRLAPPPPDPIFLFLTRCSCFVSFLSLHGHGHDRLAPTTVTTTKHPPIPAGMRNVCSRVCVRRVCGNYSDPFPHPRSHTLRRYPI